jgi:hypothetical protein
MTHDHIVAALKLIMLRLANQDDLRDPPPELELHEWAYVKGIASHAILQLIDRLRNAER